MDSLAEDLDSTVRWSTAVPTAGPVEPYRCRMMISDDDPGVRTASPCVASRSDAVRGSRALN